MAFAVLCSSNQYRPERADRHTRSYVPTNVAITRDGSTEAASQKFLALSGHGMLRLNVLSGLMISLSSSRPYNSRYPVSIAIPSSRASTNLETVSSSGSSVLTYAISISLAYSSQVSTGSGPRFLPGPQYHLASARCTPVPNHSASDCAFPFGTNPSRLAHHHCCWQRWNVTRSEARILGIVTGVSRYRCGWRTCTPTRPQSRPFPCTDRTWPGPTSS